MYLSPFVFGLFPPFGLLLLVSFTDFLNPRNYLVLIPLMIASGLNLKFGTFPADSKAKLFGGLFCLICTLIILFFDLFFLIDQAKFQM